MSVWTYWIGACFLVAGLALISLLEDASVFRVPPYWDIIVAMIVWAILIAASMVTL